MFECGWHQVCTVTALEISMGQEQKPAMEARLCICSWWFRFWSGTRTGNFTNQFGRPGIETILPSFHAKPRWRRVHGPASSVVAMLSDLGWPHELDTSKSTTGDWWEYAGGTFTNILNEIHQCTKRMEWTEASAHLDGSGLEHGADMCRFSHKQHVWLARKDVLGKEGLIKAAAVGGLWPAAD